MKSLMDDHPSLSGSNKVLQSLDKAVVEKFETAVEKDVYIPFHFATQNPVFVNRQFWSAAKLFRNILYWHVSSLFFFCLNLLLLLMAYGGLTDSYGAYMRPFCRRHSIKKSFIAFKLLSIKLSAISF